MCPVRRERYRPHPVVVAFESGQDRTLKVWDLATGAILASLEDRSGGVYTVALTPDGTRAVSGSYGRTLKIWGLSNEEEIATFHGDAAFFCCTVKSDGRFVIAGDAAGQVHVLEILE